MKNKKIAFFDFDGTLTSADTFGLFARFSVGRLRYFSAVIKSVPDLFRWKTGRITNSDAKQRLFSRLYKGRSKEWFEEKGALFAQVIDRYLNPKGMQLLATHRREGYDLCIVSASLSPWILPWARENNIQAVIATEPEYDSRTRLTGRFSTPNCHGTEKIKRVEEAFPHLESDFSEKVAYGDSKSDLHLIRFVGSGKLI